MEENWQILHYERYFSAAEIRKLVRDVRKMDSIKNRGILVETVLEEQDWEADHLPARQILDVYCWRYNVKV